MNKLKLGISVFEEKLIILSLFFYLMWNFIPSYMLITTTIYSIEKTTCNRWKKYITKG